MPAFIDLTGQKFGRLTAMKRVSSNRKGAQWLCVCRCGNEKVINGQSLRDGGTRSCGCILAESNAAYHRRRYPKGIRQEIVPEIDDLHDLVKW